MDAAVLLEASWTDMVHEVWVTIIPDEEVICLSVDQQSCHVHMCGSRRQEDSFSIHLYVKNVKRDFITQAAFFV